MPPRPKVIVDKRENEIRKHCFIRKMKSTFVVSFCTSEVSGYILENSYTIYEPYKKTKNI